MRIVVLSDSHGSKRNLYEIIEMHLDDADLFIFLGDGENDFEDASLLYPKMKYYRVAGNCDWGSTLPLYNEIKFAGKKIFFSHGHPFYVKHGYGEIIREAKARKADICLFGHTHVQYIGREDELYIMNPGAVADGKYAMIDIINNQIMLIDCKL
ncbi:MAG: YfcE family phosphodiesterase [Clostridium sp.]|nr:YfcE family phosphodiesterase [Clostridium sp.]